MPTPSPRQVAGWIEGLCALGPVGIECSRIPASHELCAALWRGQLSRIGDALRLGQHDAILLRILPLGETDCYAWQRLAEALPGQAGRLDRSGQPGRRQLARFAPERAGLIGCRDCPARCPSSVRWLRAAADRVTGQSL